MRIVNVPDVATLHSDNVPEIDFIIITRAHADPEKCERRAYARLQNEHETKVIESYLSQVESKEQQVQRP